MTLLEKAAMVHSGFTAEQWATFSQNNKGNYIEPVRAVLKAVRPNFGSMDLVRAVAASVNMEPAAVDLTVCAFIDWILAEKP